jgi:flagellar basal body-associated protein FliL
MEAVRWMKFRGKTILIAIIMFVIVWVLARMVLNYFGEDNHLHEPSGNAVRVNVK